MVYVEIKEFDDGAHGNLIPDIPLNAIPEGYAVLPNDELPENFPFGNFKVEMINGIPTVSDWKPLPIPPPPPDPPPTKEEILRADVDYLLILNGVTE